MAGNKTAQKIQPAALVIGFASRSANTGVQCLSMLERLRLQLAFGPRCADSALWPSSSRATLSAV